MAAEKYIAKREVVLQPSEVATDANQTFAIPSRAIESVTATERNNLESTFTKGFCVQALR